MSYAFLFGNTFIKSENGRQRCLYYTLSEFVLLRSNTTSKPFKETNLMQDASEIKRIIFLQGRGNVQGKLIFSTSFTVLFFQL